MNIKNYIGKEITVDENTQKVFANGSAMQIHEDDLIASIYDAGYKIIWNKNDVGQIIKN